MAFTNASLHLRPGAPGDLIYKYDAGSDTMATVATAGYFNNSDDSLNLAVDDLIYCDCADGNVILKVASISSGSVTTQYAGGDLPINTAATGTAAELSGALIAGYMEVGTSISTASRYVLPTPYAGAVFSVFKVDSGTQVFEFDAGGSGATAITYDGTNRRISLRAEGESFHVRGSSTSRWRLQHITHNASAVSEGASVVLGGT
jgi:hypothetical protein